MALSWLVERRAQRGGYLGCTLELLWSGWFQVTAGIGGDPEGPGSGPRHDPGPAGRLTLESTSGLGSFCSSTAAVRVSSLRAAMCRAGRRTFPFVP